MMKVSVVMKPENSSVISFTSKLRERNNMKTSFYLDTAKAVSHITLSFLVQFVGFAEGFKESHC
jgi:hypothetical protein